MGVFKHSRGGFLQQGRLIIYKQKFLVWHIAYKHLAGWPCMGQWGVVRHGTNTRQQEGVSSRDFASSGRRLVANGRPWRCGRARAFRREGPAESSRFNPTMPCGTLISNRDLTPSMIPTPPPDNAEEDWQRRRIANSSVGYAPCPVWPRPYGIPCPDGRPAARHPIEARTVWSCACGPRTPTGGRGVDDDRGPQRYFPHRLRAPLKLNVPHGGARQTRLSAPPVRPRCGGIAPHSTCAREWAPPPLSAEPTVLQVRPRSEMTDGAIARAARGMAEHVCAEYGEAAPRCYGDDGAFCWRLWWHTRRETLRRCRP